MGHTPAGQANALTIDVEDYFHAEAFAKLVSRDRWPKLATRVEHNTNRLLQILDGQNVHATFFTLGCVAEQYPALVTAIHNAGHEIASHGYAHTMITKTEPDEFREDIRRAKNILEDITGTPVLGYRAPTFSIVTDTLWALDILAEEKYSYDSSIFPIHHDRYGIPGADRFPHTVPTKSGAPFIEFPLSTARLLGQNLPIAGGGYLRLLPLTLIMRGIQSINRQNHPAIIYLHPWEIDPDQPKLGLRGAAKLRHYANLNKMAGKLTRLIKTFKFAPAKTVLSRALQTTDT